MRRIFCRARFNELRPFKEGNPWSLVDVKGKVIADSIILCEQLSSD